MSNSKYKMAGWLALAQAILFPLSFIVAIAQTAFFGSGFKPAAPVFGPSDLMFVVVTALSVYILIQFRTLLNERYNFTGIDTLIAVAIWLYILFQIGGLLLKGISIILWPMHETLYVVLSLAPLAISMLAMGIVDVMIGIRLLKAGESLNELIVALAYITLAAGGLELTVILSPLALILVPISMVILAMIFLREKEELEFV